MMKKSVFPLIFSVIILSLIGIIFVFESSGNIKNLFSQFVFVAGGVVLMFFISRTDYRFLKRYSFVLLIFLIISLILVLFPGVGVKINGARRWINLRIFTFQPTEIAKLILVIFFAHWFSNEEKGRLFAFFLLLGLIFVLIMLQPDMGTGLIIIFASLLMLFISKTTALKNILILFPILILCILAFIKISNYRSDRLFSFLRADKEKYDQGYHANQALISIGSGGIFGVGVGKSKQKYSFLPESSTDSIFGIISEETGFVGSAMLIFGYFLILYWGLKISENAKDVFGKFLSFGIVIFITFQAFLNFSSMLSLTPLTGVPLPFISSGGTAILVQFSMIGLLLSVARF